VTTRPQPSLGPYSTAHTPVIEVVEDTTASRRAVAREGALKACVRRYQATFERGALGQLTVDFPSFRIDAANKAFCTLTGFSDDAP
jgi:hypothetical protein